MLQISGLRMSLKVLNENRLADTFWQRTTDDEIVICVSKIPIENDMGSA